MQDDTSLPLIVGFVADLMFTTKIANAARHAGFQVRWIEGAGQLGEAGPAERPGESLHGRDGRLFETLTAWQPALLVFDLANTAVPWRHWLAALKSSPATRRIPILAFGPHTDTEALQAALSAGADAVVARSRFTAAMPALFRDLARLPDFDELRETCREPLAPLALAGIRLFNAGDYYQAHDALEEAWRQDEGPGRDLYRGILQVGIAYYQIGRGNYRGAVKMLLRVRQWLDPLPDVCRGVDVAQLRLAAAAVHEAVVALGPDGLAAFDPSLFTPVVLVPDG